MVRFVTTRMITIVLTISVRLWSSRCIASYFLRRPHGCSYHPCPWLWRMRSSSRPTRQRHLLPPRTRQEIGLLYCLSLLGLHRTTLRRIYARSRILLEASNLHFYSMFSFLANVLCCLDYTFTSNSPLRVHCLSLHSYLSRNRHINVLSSSHRHQTLTTKRDTLNTLKSSLWHHQEDPGFRL
jgi:hypothetical protein